jgi:hypothetical protein
MKNIQIMITEHGGLAAVQRNYLHIENPPFMRLVIEVVGTLFPNGTCEVSVAHYGTQNGDSMRDPEITFLVTPNSEGEWQWKPLTFLNDYVGVYQVASEYDNFAHLRVRDAKLVRELEEFAEMWDRNIKHQGFVEAFRSTHARTPQGAANGATSAVP